MGGIALITRVRRLTIGNHTARARPRLLTRSLDVASKVAEALLRRGGAAETLVALAIAHPLYAKIGSASLWARNGWEDRLRVASDAELTARAATTAAAAGAHVDDDDDDDDNDAVFEDDAVARPPRQPRDAAALWQPRLPPFFDKHARHVARNAACRAPLLAFVAARRVVRTAGEGVGVTPRLVATC